MTLIDDLFIYWHQPDGMVEVPGIAFYGYWAGEAIPDGIAKLAGSWAAVESEVAFRSHEMEHGNWLTMQVWVKSWPTDPAWRAAVEATLNGMIDSGAEVAWCGGDYCSASLLELNPRTYNGFVYAAASAGRGVILHSDLSSDAPIFLSESDVLSLRSFPGSEADDPGPDASLDQDR